MAHDSDMLKVQTALELRVCRFHLGHVQAKLTSFGRPNTSGAASRRFHVIHEPEPFFHPRRVAAHMFETKHRITMTGQVARLGEIRIPVSAASVRKTTTGHCPPVEGSEP
jgi:hypothetical protein